MPLSSSTQPSLRARILPRFPAQVIAGNGLVITKSGGVYTFSAVPIGDVPLEALGDIGSNRLLGRDADGNGPIQQLTVGSGLGFNGVGGIELIQNQRLATVNVQMPIAGTLGVNATADYLMPFAGVIQKITLLANPSGSIVLDIWKNTYANFPPVVGNSITGSVKPTISAGVKTQILAAGLTGWNTMINADDILRFSVVSLTSINRVCINLDVLVI